ncbi:hypothetical protein B0H14DRAFT_3160845 [Mycena olivaceomarginata]|nr:hypothetical protein B0H14DRAFT_3160845 [Mycena olivaceomarginata]
MVKERPPTTIHSHSRSRSNGRKKMVLCGNELLKMKNAANSLSHVSKQWMKKWTRNDTLPPKNDARAVKNSAVPEDGIVFKVVVDADGNTLEGDPDPDNVAHLELFKRVFEEPGPDMLGVGTQRLRVKTVTWFVNVKLEARFEAAKELLASLGIDNSETSLFHGTAANSIQPILEGGFLIPGVSSGGKMANGKTEGYGIYLAPTASASLGYARGINKMFMCRVITGRISNEISHAKPRPLGQNGHESWYGTGASVGHFYVVKHVELVLPRYVVEFDVPVPPLFNPFNFAPAIDPPAFAPPLPPLIPPRRFGAGRVSAIKRGAAENQNVKGKGKARTRNDADFRDQQRKKRRAEIEEGEVVRNRMDGPATVESSSVRPLSPASTINSAVSTVRANVVSGSGANCNAVASSSAIRAPSPIPSTFADSIRRSVAGSVSGSSPIRSISPTPSVIIDPNYKLVELSDSQLYAAFGLEPNTATSFPESSTQPEDQDAQSEDEQMADATVATTSVGVAA